MLMVTPTSSSLAMSMAVAVWPTYVLWNQEPSRVERSLRRSRLTYSCLKWMPVVISNISSLPAWQPVCWFAVATSLMSMVVTISRVRSMAVMPLVSTRPSVAMSMAVVTVRMPIPTIRHWAVRRCLKTFTIIRQKYRVGLQ